MRFLKILVIFLCVTLFAPLAFAQSVPIQPKFGIGFSLGFPSSLHFIARDIAGVQGLAVRGDLGAVFTPVGIAFYSAINTEYYFALPGGIGAYLGLGTFVYKALGERQFVPGDPNSPGGEFPWQVGLQWNVGFELNFLFFEVGWRQVLISSDSTEYFSGPRFVIGIQFYF